MPRNKRSLLDSVYKSAGMEYLNRQKSHQFSFNIFKGNYEELKKVLAIIGNPTLFNKVMCDTNREKMGNPIHMELNRYFHNFLASAKTLIDHTRVFLRQYYNDTQFKSEFDLKVKNEFVDDPLSRFIQDLRNYMLHKGLVGNSLSMTITKIKGTENFHAKSKASLKKSDLLEWKKWSKEGKTYLLAQDENFKISEFCFEYGEKVLNFYVWFYQELQNHHSEDYAELIRAQKELERCKKND